MGNVYAANGVSDRATVMQDYKIRKGDTLYSISKASGIPVSILAKDNNIKDSTKINTGDTIILGYHPKDWEKYNSDEMNDMFPNMNDQEDYFQRVDMYEQARYEQVSKMGAQEYNKQQAANGKKVSVFQK